MTDIMPVVEASAVQRTMIVSTIHVAQRTSTDGKGKLTTTTSIAKQNYSCIWQVILTEHEPHGMPKAVT